MGELFNQHLRVLGRETCYVENFFRRDGTLECQQQRILRTRNGERSILFAEFWYNHRGVQTWQRESEFRESSDYKYIRRTYKCDAFGNKTKGHVETITLENPKRAAAIAAQRPTQTPDDRLRLLLSGYGLTLPDADQSPARELPKPKEAAPDPNYATFFTIDSRTLLPPPKK